MGRSAAARPTLTATAAAAATAAGTATCTTGVGTLAAGWLPPVAQHGVCSETGPQLCGQAAGFHHGVALERRTAPPALLGSCRRVIRRLLLPFLYKGRMADGILFISCILHSVQQRLLAFPSAPISSHQGSTISASVLMTHQSRRRLKVVVWYFPIPQVQAKKFHTKGKTDQ